MSAKRKYWWETWFARPRTVIRRGVDYTCSQSTMAQNIRNNASAHGVRVRITDAGDSITIEVMGEILHTDPVTVAG